MWTEWTTLLLLTSWRSKRTFLKWVYMRRELHPLTLPFHSLSSCSAHGFPNMQWEETPWQHKVSPDGDHSSLKRLLNPRARRGLGGCKEKKWVSRQVRRPEMPDKTHMIHAWLCWWCLSDFCCSQLQKHGPDSPSWGKFFKNLKMMFGQGYCPAKSSLHPVTLLCLTGHHFWGHCAIFPNKAGVVPGQSEEVGTPHSPMTSGGQVRLMWQPSTRRCLVRGPKRTVDKEEN